jgi:hypothetical protein
VQCSSVGCGVVQLRCVVGHRLGRSSVVAAWLSCWLGVAQLGGGGGGGAVLLAGWVQLLVHWLVVRQARVQFLTQGEGEVERDLGEWR